MYLHVARRLHVPRRREGGLRCNVAGLRRHVARRGERSVVLFGSEKNARSTVEKRESNARSGVKTKRQSLAFCLVRARAETDPRRIGSSTSAGWRETRVSTMHAGGIADSSCFFWLCLSKTAKSTFRGESPAHKMHLEQNLRYNRANEMHM